jgi:hypothetical protein
MEEKRNFDEFTTEELLRCIQTERRIFWLEEYHLIRHDLLDKVKRTLDLKNIMDMTLSNDKRVRNVINKYAKPCKREKDTKKMFKKLEDMESYIGRAYVDSVMDIMELVYKILYTEAFDKDMPSLEIWYEFEMEDMVLVNDIIRDLKGFNSLNVDEDDILKSLDRAVTNYVYCIDNGIDYPSTFDSKFLYVNIKKEEQENAHE